MIGNRDVIERVALAEKVSLDHVAIVNPETASDLPIFCERFEKIERYKKMGVRDTRALMTNPNYYAAMMLQYGQVDALVGGVSSYSGSLLRPLIQLVKLLPHSPFVSGCIVADLPNKKMGTMVSCFLRILESFRIPMWSSLPPLPCRRDWSPGQVFGTRPRIAMLSFSTKGSAKTKSTEKVARAVAIVRELADQLGVEIVVDGEMQADTALVPEVAQRKMGPSTVGRKANLLIFPDLNSGNISAKLIQYLAGSSCIWSDSVGFFPPRGRSLARG